MKTVDILIGIIGSGKSQLAKEIQKENGAVILSSDEIRKELINCGRIPSENNVATRQVVFDEIHKRLRSALLRGDNVVLDAVNSICRNEYFDIIKGCGRGTKIIGRVLLIDKETAVERVKNREKNDPNSHIVPDPESVAEFMLNEIKNNYPSLEEGFDELIFYMNNKIFLHQKR